MILAHPNLWLENVAKWWITEGTTIRFLQIWSGATRKSRFLQTSVVECREGRRRHVSFHEKNKHAIPHWASVPFPIRARMHGYVYFGHVC